MTGSPSLIGVMTPFPWSIEIEASAADARHMMLQHGIRHLPVTREGDLVGVISDRDLRIGDKLGAGATVEELYTPDPYVVEDTTALARVVRYMAQEQIGSALVTRSGKLVGILTTTDVCQLLADLLGGGEDGHEVA